MLILLCVPVCSTGCLYAPAEPAERRTGIDAVGAANSDSAVQIGVTTRAQAVAVLGKPQRVSSDNRAIEYSYHPITGHRGYVFLGGPCGMCGYYPWDVHTHETLWLAFDTSGIVSRAASTRDALPISWSAFCAAATASPPASTTAPTTQPISLKSQIGNTVHLVGRFGGPGMQAEYLMVNGEEIYLMGKINIAGQKLQYGDSISVEGVLKLHQEAPPSDPLMQIAGDYFFVENPAVTITSPSRTMP